MVHPLSMDSTDSSHAAALPVHSPLPEFVLSVFDYLHDKIPVQVKIFVFLLTFSSHKLHEFPCPDLSHTQLDTISSVCRFAEAGFHDSRFVFAL